LTRVVVTCGERIKVACSQIGASQHAIAAALPALVELVAIAIAIALWDVGTSTLINLTGSVAHATRIERAHAVVDVVTHAVHVFIRSAVATTHADRVELVAVAVAVAFWNVKTSTIVDVTWSATHPAGIQSLARPIVKRGGGVVVASCLVCASLNNAVADTITVRICFTAATTVAQGIELVAITIAVACGDVGASTIVNLTWSIADATCVECTDAVVDVVTDAIGISVCHAVTVTHAEGVELIAIAVAVAGWDV